MKEIHSVFCSNYQDEEYTIPKINYTLNENNQIIFTTSNIFPRIMVDVTFEGSISEDVKILLLRHIAFNYYNRESANAFPMHYYNKYNALRI